MPLYVILDENLKPEIAYALNNAGHPATSFRDRGLLGLKDWELPEKLIAGGLTICTQDDDWETQYAGRSHPGVLVVGVWTTEMTYWALRQFLDQNAGRKLTNCIVPIPLASQRYIDDHPADLSILF